MIWLNATMGMTAIAAVMESRMVNGFIQMYIPIPALGCNTPALGLTGNFKSLPCAGHHGPPAPEAREWRRLPAPKPKADHEEGRCWPEAEDDGALWKRQNAGMEDVDLCWPGNYIRIMARG